MTTILARDALPPGYQYSQLNLITNAIRGMNLGLSFMGLLIVFLCIKEVPKTTIGSLAIICLCVLSNSFVGFSYDYLLLSDCLTRVKILYIQNFVNGLAYWVFEANLTYQVSNTVADYVIGRQYIIPFALIVRMAVGILPTIFNTSTVAPNRTCVTVARPTIILADRLMEVALSVFYSSIFLFSIMKGVREIDSVNGTGDVSSANRNSANEGWAISAKKYLLRTIRAQGFILLLSVVFQVAFLLIIYNLTDSTAIGSVTAGFISQNTVLMSIHILSSIVRRKQNKRHTESFQHNTK
ncbi:hypothetical protein HDU83_002410 [Entophlyctis luteolus]|nr:hypothetical protein HDU83_002410 [Entophlyctis luteolus]